MTERAAEGSLQQFLSENAMFYSLTEKEIDKFLEYTDVVWAEKGEIIANVGVPSDSLDFLLDGKVELQHGPEDKPVSVGQMKKGEMIGELSFFDQKPRQIRIVADSAHVTLLRLKRPLYMRLRVEYPFIAVNLLEFAIISLDRLMRRTSAEIANMNQYLYRSTMS
ncbi:MAG: Crp/Fnr family transcriptional regulator [bacterium]